MGGPEGQFTQRELDIMSILWRRGSGTVAEVKDEYGSEAGYTGVLKLLQILEEKGLIRHEKEGRAHRYFPNVGPEDAGGAALGRIVDKIFLGSAELAVARLVSDRRLDRAEVERLKALLDESISDDDRASEEGDA